MADAYDGWNDSDEEAEEETTEDQTPQFKPSYLLVAIDTDKSMFELDDSGKSPFMHCLEACYEMVNSLILTWKGSGKGPLAIILAENKLTKANFVDFEHSIPDTIKLLKNLKELSNTELQKKYERTEDFELADFFLLCKNKLSAIKGEVYKRYIAYLTNDENPAQNDAKLKFKIINESQKFQNLQINLNVFTFKVDFDPSLLYTEILRACDGYFAHITHLVDFPDKLTKFIQQKYRKYRSKLFPFLGNSELYIDVVHNNFIDTGSIKTNLSVTRDTQKEVKKSIRRKYVAEYKYKYKRELSLTFDAYGKADLFETNLPIGYTLIHVGEETHRDGWIIEPPVLIEKHREETDLKFESFWQFCKDKNLCLVCWRKLKSNGDVRIVELTPKYVNNTYMFLIQIIPYALDIQFPKTIKTDYTFTAEEETVMSELVNALTIDYNPFDYNDPVDGKREAYIKSQLLEEPELQKFNSGLPTDEEIDEKIVNQIEKLQDLDLLDETVAAAAPPKRFRQYQAGAKTKKVKKEK